MWMIDVFDFFFDLFYIYSKKDKTNFCKCSNGKDIPLRPWTKEAWMTFNNIREKRQPGNGEV